MKVVKPLPPDVSRRFVAPLLLVIVLAILFWRSFLPEYVHFSNDGPLGMQNAEWLHLPEGFAGMWYDLNSLGANSGQASPDFISLIRWIVGPLGYSKFLAPICLWILGFSAWFCFRQMRFTSLAAILGGLAAMLVSTSFSDACWGVASHEIAIGMDFCAFGLFAGNAFEPYALKRWLRLALAGLAVGMNVIEAADIGAIMSVFIALFIFFKSLTEENASVPVKSGRAISRVIVVAIFSGFIALQTVLTLVGTGIQGISGMGQDIESKARNWDYATQWSLPKKETLGIIVPGLFGYRMDTPKDMAIAFQDAYKGGNYWGGIGRTPAIDRYFDSGGKDNPPQAIMRFSGTGEYVGILVMLIAIWAIAQSFRRQNSVFTLPQRKFIWLGLAILIFSLLMSWGRFFPVIYSAFYSLPYASTIRNPAKFLLVFTFVTVLLFGYGVHGLSKMYLQPAGIPSSLGKWWARVRGFDRKWTVFSAGTVIISLLAWFIYISKESKLIAYLKTVGFGDDGVAQQIASFSIGQVGWFILFFALSVGLVILIIAGVFSGKRAQLGGILLVALLVIDLGRANLPWIVHWDYKQKYEIGTLNPIARFLAEKPYEHRVAYGIPTPMSTPPDFSLFSQLWGIEWLQQIFPYYNIPTLDKIQMPREPVDLEAFESALRMGIKFDENGRAMLDNSTFPRVSRFWELTDTRYLLGPAQLLDLYNAQFDPGQHRYRIVQRFSVTPKPGATDPQHRLEEWTAVPDDNGPYALFDFTGALPRVKLYTSWETNSAADLKIFSTNNLSSEDFHIFNEAGTNCFLTLKKLASPSFDPHQTVLLDAPLPQASPSIVTNQNSGTVDFENYKPTDIKLKAAAVAPSVLLFNDKFDPNWKAFVDGKPAPIFHANFIMRGVFVPAGMHNVEFQFRLPLRPFYISAAGVVFAILLIVVLIFLRNKP